MGPLKVREWGDCGGGKEVNRSSTITSLRWVIPLTVESISERKHYGWIRDQKFVKLPIYIRDIETCPDN